MNYSLFEFPDMILTMPQHFKDMLDTCQYYGFMQCGTVGTMDIGF